MLQTLQASLIQGFFSKMSPTQQSMCLLPISSSFFSYFLGKTVLKRGLS